MNYFDCVRFSKPNNQNKIIILYFSIDVESITMLETSKKVSAN